MQNSTIRINLAAFVHVVSKMKNKEGKEIEGIFIPLEKNHIFRGTKGMYVDFVAFPIKNKQADIKDTHIVKQSFSKEIREAMTKEQQESQPIFGNMIDWNYAGTSNEDTTIANDQPALPSEENDLPF